MGLFKDIKQGVGLTIGNKLTESSISGGKKLFWVGVVGASAIALTGYLRTEWDEAGSSNTPTMSAIVQGTLKNVKDAPGLVSEFVDSVKENSPDRQRCKNIGAVISAQLSAGLEINISEDDMKFFNNMENCPLPGQ